LTVLEGVDYPLALLLEMPPVMFVGVCVCVIEIIMRRNVYPLSLREIHF